MALSPATAPKTPTIPTIPKRPPALGANALRRADLERGSFFCVVPNETTFEQVMTPAFWQHHAGALGLAPGARPYAKVEVMRQDGTMDLELRVTRVQAGAVHMRCLRKHVDDSNLDRPADGNVEEKGDLTMPDGYKAAHTPNGATPGWLVRLPNGDVLAKGLASKVIAAAAARKHFAETSAPAET